MSESKPKVHIYNHTIVAVILAAVCSIAIAQHFAAVLPNWLYEDPLAHEEFTPDWLAMIHLALFLIYLTAAKLWNRPVHLYLNEGREELKDLARKRINGFYRFFILLSVIVTVAEQALSIPVAYMKTGSMPPQLLFGYFLIPSVLGTYYFIYLVILYLEPYIFNKVVPRLYEGEELFRLKKGATLSIRLKLWLLVISLVVVPMLLVSASVLQHQEHFTAIWPAPVAFVLVALTYILGYCEVLYKSITQPLDELVRKMERVARGDFSVKTRVYSDDELGRIKGHFNIMLDDLAERERLKDTFGKYVSVEVAKQLIESGKIELGGENIEATIIFSDIRNFTSMSEKMSPKDVVEFLNTYFSYITTPIMDHNGVINKFIGDAVMAVFAPQFGSEDHVDDALKAVLDMRGKLDEFNEKSAMDARISFGVGLHTGVLVAGNVGTETRLEYTLIGDTVNIASRIESQNKKLDSTILISQDAYDRAGPEVRKKATFEKCENIRIRGKEKPLTLYKVN